jgi:copper(I)-binding protein
LFEKEMKTVKQILVFWLAMVFLLSGCATPATEGIEIQDAWTRPAAQGMNGAVYFVIRSSPADEIVGITSDVAEAVEIHESKMSGDVMEMHPLHSVPLPAGEEVLFEPGGLHIMLIGLKQDLKLGDDIQVALQFKNAQDIQLRVPVQDSAESGANH